MRIFKKEFSEKLTEGMLVGECIITKINNTEYGNFMVCRKTNEGSFPYLGIFGLLEHAVNFVQAIEKNDRKFEYYCQFEKNFQEGWDKEHLCTMGQLGWELCGIDSNTTDEEGRSFYIYKRELPIQPENEYEEDEEDGEWAATKEQLNIRSKVPARVLDFEYYNKTDQTQEISVHFGKNGLGLTNELTIIGEKINELSQNGLVYLKDCRIDEIDDVYDLTFIFKPVENIEVKPKNLKKDYEWFNHIVLELNNYDIKDQAKLLNMIKDFLF